MTVAVSHVRFRDEVFSSDVETPPRQGGAVEAVSCHLGEAPVYLIPIVIVRSRSKARTRPVALLQRRYFVSIDHFTANRLAHDDRLHHSQIVRSEVGEIQTNGWLIGGLFAHGFTQHVPRRVAPPDTCCPIPLTRNHPLSLTFN